MQICENISNTILPLMERICSNEALKSKKDKTECNLDFLSHIDHENSMQLANLLGINHEQSVLLSVSALFTVQDDECTTKELCSFLGISHFIIPKLEKELEKLVNKNLLVKARKSGHNHYWVPRRLLAAPESILNPEYSSDSLEIDQLEKMTNGLMSDLNDRLISVKEATASIQNLQLKFPEQELLKWMKEISLSENEQLLFLAIIHGSSGGTSTFDVDQWLKEHFPRTSDRIHLRNRFYSESSDLFLNGVLEFRNIGLFDLKDVSLSQKTIKKIYGVEPEIDYSKKIMQNILLKIVPENISEKKLFYNSQEEKQISLLRNTFNQKAFDKIQSQLRDRNLQSGVTCLLHGIPGSGKTESILQLARECGRTVFQIEMSKIRGMYVGESEKNMKAIFTEYRKAADRLALKPILLFNEADALFNQRINANNSSAIGNNAMQNILLQELEDFDGILVATTNLLKSLDTAFNRRFLFKVEFKMPEQDVRRLMWANRFPEFSNVQINELANRYSLTGGQMENISKKALLYEMFEEKHVDYSLLVNLVEEELSGFTKRNQAMGFALK